MVDDTGTFLSQSMFKTTCAETLIKLRDTREALVAAWLTIFAPRKLAALRNNKALALEVQERWHKHSIDVWCLVYEQDNRDELVEKESKSQDASLKIDFVVFIDPAYSIDWIADGDLDPAAVSFISKAESIAAIDCDFLSSPKLLEYRVQIAHAIVCALQGQIEEADKLLAQAQSYLAKRTIERSREWTLCSLLMLSSLTVVACTFWGTSWIQTENWLTIPIPLTFGFLGAFASIAARTGKQSWDAASGCLLHFLEVAMRLSVGAIFGLVATNLASSTFGPEPIQTLIKTWQGSSVVAFSAGLFEKTIPRILSQYSRNNKLIISEDHGTKSNPH